MNGSANFIPLGLPGGKPSFDQLKPRKPKVISETPEERKRIAAEIRKDAKKEKKLVKADAKRQRKLNSILHRRMTKNPEKYTQNKERNQLCAIESERNKIWSQAVRQAQQLAAKHDPSGKLFNVGELVTLEDGSLKSKVGLANKEKRKTEKAVEGEAKELLLPQHTHPKNGTMSKNQQRKQAALYPRATPPRPVVPEGFVLPEGEENFIAMWDITDEQILNRLSADKWKKSMARKNLRREQKAAKKINKAMKQLKRQTENLGQRWDPIEGRKLVLMQVDKGASEEDSQEDDSEEGSQDEGQDVEREFKANEESDEAEEFVEPVKIEMESKKSKKTKKTTEPATTTMVEAAAAAQVSETKKTKNLKRSAEDDFVEEPKSKRSKKPKKSQESDSQFTDTIEAVEICKTEEDSRDAPSPEQEAEEKTLSRAEKRALREEKRALRAQKHAQKEGKCAEKAKKDGESESSPKKRKYVANAVDATVKNAVPYKRNRKSGSVDQSALTPSLDKHEPFYTETSGEPVASIAAQWNPDALTGEAARKDKFLRLLGAGKANAAASVGGNFKSTVNTADVSKVQSDLERQYEAGMKMKHDGGGKRRGLGA